ncbi:hypothetical protein BDN71DRAFT_1440942 [Pleurotus eryngii]|uniref:Uncharacterized protein n=1 Tax=Pleurotus eryngii TaxID=5323 RepID=A0A9P6A734_PLEER|nr:hypothetical protein BDN71DRAFT_1440942 [Pleurotus eryngii]
MPKSYSVPYLFWDNQTIKFELSCQCITVTYSFQCRLSKRNRPYLLFRPLQTEMLVSYLFQIQLN